VSGAMPDAPKLIKRLNRIEKPYCIVTNDASRLPNKAAARYRSYGLDVDAENIITSGGLLPEYFAKHGLRGSRCVVLGPADSRRYVELAGGEVVPADAVFDVLVIGDESGFPFLDTVDMALSTLFKMIDAGRPIHLVLPNPDLIYPSGVDSFGIAAGAVAMLFEAALRRRYRDRPGLEFARLGKPYPHLYEAAMARCDTRDVVMIGDQLETDIAGANGCGIDSALITTGVSIDDLASLPEKLQPTWWIKSLTE
jgi:HAD superfamily hydrolase (TIGR01450 family)